MSFAPADQGSSSPPQEAMDLTQSPSASAEGRETTPERRERKGKYKAKSPTPPAGSGSSEEGTTDRKDGGSQEAPADVHKAQSEQDSDLAFLASHYVKYKNISIDDIRIIYEEAEYDIDEANLRLGMQVSLAETRRDTREGESSNTGAGPVLTRNQKDTVNTLKQLTELSSTEACVSLLTNVSWDLEVALEEYHTGGERFRAEVADLHRSTGKPEQLCWDTLIKWSGNPQKAWLELRDKDEAEARSEMDLDQSYYTNPDDEERGLDLDASGSQDDDDSDSDTEANGEEKGPEDAEDIEKSNRGKDVDSSSRKDDKSPQAGPSRTTGRETKKISDSESSDYDEPQEGSRKRAPKKQDQSPNKRANISLADFARLLK